MKRVVVTGMGVISPIGNSCDDFWENAKKGISGADYISLFDTKCCPVKVACEIKNYLFKKDYPNNKSFRNIPRQFQFALSAIKEAMEMSRFEPEHYDPCDIGILMGVGAMLPGNYDFFNCFTKSSGTSGNFNYDAFFEKGVKELHPLWLLQYLPNMIVSYISRLFNINGQSISMNTACSTGTQVIGEAYEKIKYGKLKAAVVGACDSRISPFGVAGYYTLGAISTQTENPESISRPFDKRRDGFVIGEGSGSLVLEEFEQAKKRNVEILAEIIGFGATVDAYSNTDPDPSGKKAAKAMSIALEEAAIPKENIQYINAHGTSTIKNDIAETKAVKVCFDKHAYKLYINSLKSMTGHLSAAAGMVEAISAILCLKNSIIFPTINYQEKDPECDLFYVPQIAVEKKELRYAMSNSFGFGGQNSSIILKKWQ